MSSTVGLIDCFVAVLSIQELPFFPSTGTGPCDGYGMQNSRILIQQCCVCSEFQLQPVTAEKVRQNLMMSTSRAHSQELREKARYGGTCL